MELKVRDGDYLPDGQGGFQRAEGTEELLQRVMWKLCVRRGSFPLLPQLGSRLYLLLGEKSANREALARQYVAEALAGERDLEVAGVQLDGAGHLQADLLWRGRSLSVTAEV